MMLRSLQLILHLPLLKIILPANVISTFNIIIPVAMFDVLDNDDLSIEPLLIFEFDDEGTEMIRS